MLVAAMPLLVKLGLPAVALLLVLAIVLVAPRIEGREPGDQVSPAPRR